MQIGLLAKRMFSVAVVLGTGLVPATLRADPPLAVRDFFATTEEVPLEIDPPGLLANDVDLAGESLILQSAGGLSNGTFTVLVTNGRFTYVPDPGFVGTDTFTYTMRNASGDTSTAQATIEVLPDPNRDPVAVDDAYATPANVSLAIDPPGLLANDLELDGESLILTSAGGLSNGSFSVLVTNGRFTYVPDPGFVGTDTFSYTVRDASNNTATAGASIQVFAPMPDTPVAVDDAYATTEETDLEVDPPGLLSNDVDAGGESLLLQSAGGLSNGTFTVLVTNGRFTYVPDPGFVGTDTFTYTMRNASGDTSTAQATIEVLPDPNRDPVAVDDAYATPANVSLAIDPPGLLANDLELDGESLILTSAGGLSNGSFSVLVTNGRFTYVPDPGFVGTDTFSYTVRDASNNTATGQATIQVITAPEPGMAISLLSGLLLLVRIGAGRGSRVAAHSSPA